ncbi:MAG TPA: ABC transporter permease [Candidatus Marinimicrobia bacterium]|nr:ABC transporter permease [Candidatus Neomarinimicrobiota bacterium]HIC74628.1 ABC transporter permease [Candidatus Neomarinimicrobiota bacterium]HIN61947.1 ABC transporter permease [Candidatus Neomarinimicrobiota bacterium]
MTIFSAFFNRRLAQLRHRWIGELSLALLLPIGIYITVGFGLSESIPKLQDIPQLGWLIPGVVLMVAFAGALIAVFNDLLQNRGLNGFYCSVYASPYTTASTVMSLMFSILPEGVVRSLLALGILQVLLGYAYPFVGQLLFLFLIFLAVMLGGAAGLTLGIIGGDAVASQMVILLILIGLGFCSEWFVPVDVFPTAVQPLLHFLPTTILAELSRGLLLNQNYSPVLILVVLGTVALWTVFNSFLFPRISSE